MIHRHSSDATRSPRASTPCLVAALALSLLSSCDDPVELLPEGEPGLYRMSFEHDGETREAVVYVPEAYDPGTPAPLMLNFHGYGGTSEAHLQWADMRPLADQDGFILAYPQGSLMEGDPHWNAGLDTEENKSDADDFGFFELLLDELVYAYAIDTERVYAAGYSNGAMFAFALACYHSDQVAAVVSVSGAMLTETEQRCEPTHPTSVLTLHGTDDSVLPYDGGEGILPAEDVLSYWTGFNQTATEPETSTDTSDGTTIEYLSYGDGSNGTAVDHYRMVGGGHVWFDESFGGDGINTVIWDFVSAYDVNGAL